MEFVFGNDFDKLIIYIHAFECVEEPRALDSELSIVKLSEHPRT